MRIELAKLLQANDVLLLMSLHFGYRKYHLVREFLCNYPGVVVDLPLHDVFLDNVTNRTIEISLE
jgi:ATP-binding cassette subfamily F protein 3